MRVEGTVQGVGFRPFVYRLANRFGIRGWVLNDAKGVLIAALAPVDVLDRFEVALRAESPPAAKIDRIYKLDTCPGSPNVNAGDGFAILGGGNRSGIEAAIPPDLAVCPDCLREMRDPADRRYRYPFINCTNCGPRYSIIESIPYDRPATTMRKFPLCPACRAEYENPAERRFHAQPVACPDCGPHLSFLDRRGTKVADKETALLRAIGRMRHGEILAVKGIGGFHLMCDAANDDAVKTLRERKHREEKPFALMVPYSAAARRLCALSPREAELLGSARAPIVLASRRALDPVGVSRYVAPGSPLLGIMLPYAPLHHLMMEAWQGVLVATSGNLSDEPICIDDEEALERLSGIADGFLVHDRPIARPVDDSVVRFMNGEAVVFRRARGYAPAPVPAPAGLPRLLAVGAHLKNTVAVTAGDRLFPSQHIGDLTTPPARAAFSNAIDLLSQLYHARPEAVVCDLHPDYPSSVWAGRQGLPVIRVQHHHAHVLSCLAEHRIAGPALGVAWDGTGYGTDKTAWGGEWLEASLDQPGFRRRAALRQFSLPGGERAIRRPALTALGLLWELFGEEALSRDEVFSILGLPERELKILERMIARQLNTPKTSSAGRLFDGVASLLGLGNTVSFEAQAAMKLEFLASESNASGRYEFQLQPFEPIDADETSPAIVIDWAPMIRGILEELGNRTDKADIARRFHNTLAGMILAVARETHDLPVVLTGGCFQNKLLFETAAQLLKADGFEVYGHREVPPNDGGISIGQIVSGSRRMKELLSRESQRNIRHSTPSSRNLSPDISGRCDTETSQLPTFNI